ncbi:Uncharacterised protein [uncultured archaeon]|nr:Uncharacterised protein [uncultured archaeon]
MEYLMTYGWALLVIVIVIAVLLYINPFRAPEQCLFDQAGFLCSKPVLLVSGADAGGARVNSLLHATLTNGQRETIVIQGVMCLSTRVPPPGEFGQWPTASGLGTTVVTRTLGYQESLDLGNFTADGSTTPDSSVQCLTTTDFTPGNTHVVTIRPGETFSGRLYVAYNYASDTPGTPAKIVGANIVTQAQ